MKLEEVKKVPIGINVIPETFFIFKAGAKLFNVNLSQFLNMVIHRRNTEGFVYYDVDPKYGEVSDATRQTILYVSEEQRALLQEWADRENRSLTSIVRCLMDITANKMLEYDREVRDSNGDIKPEFENKAKIEIFDTFELMGVLIYEYIDECLKNFKDINIRKISKCFTQVGVSIFENKVNLTDNQLLKLQSISNRQKVNIERVKLAFEFYLLTSLVDQKSTYCHVSKEQFISLKRICQDIGYTPSKLLNEKIDLLKADKYHTPELSKNVELLRVNVSLEKKTILILEHYCNVHRIKMAEAVRNLTNYINNFFEQEGVNIPATYVF